MDAIAAEIERRLDAIEPRSLLAVGAHAPALVRAWAARHGASADEVADGDDAAINARLDSLGRRDFALVAGLVERLPADRGARVLARLRDVNVPRLCLVVPARTPGWAAADLAALGFTALARDAAGGRALYGFDIASYKTTPDWLGPRHWAHPERWDKHRW